MRDHTHNPANTAVRQKRPSQAEANAPSDSSRNSPSVWCECSVKLAGLKRKKNHPHAVQE
ncbi:hypothetical protein DAT35_56745 [Vitiosangium sp. GDMCC 1.1324]|nr:hypothetical protein DAT35_56745 [Vitiosangium sp. GDMCC 1.1324]